VSRDEPRRLSRAEYDRMWRVLGMALSGHAMLRDRYQRRDRALVLIVLALSVIATALAFLSGESNVQIGPFSARLAVWLGVLTTIIFFLTLVDLVVGWRQKAWAHEEAAKRLSELKVRFRSVGRSGDVVETGDVDLFAEYHQTMAAVPPISERQFLPVKAAHVRKVAVSKLISSHPGAPLYYLRLLAMIRGIRTPPSEDEPVEEPPA
jgi:hypothetical protein